VARLFLQNIENRRGFSETGIDLHVSDAACSYLVKKGYSYEYGARQLKRYTEDQLVSPMAQMISGIGDPSRGAGVEVTTSQETRHSKDMQILAEMNGPLSVKIHRRDMMKTRKLKKGFQEVCELRREAHQHLHLEEVTDLKDRIDFLMTQLAGVKKKKRKDPRQSAQFSEMQTEYQRLKNIWESARNHLRELESAEEWVLSAIFEEEDPSPYWENCRAIYEKFLTALFYLLVARRTARNQVTLLVQELDDQRAFDYWLGPLLEHMTDRKWNIAAHAPAGKENHGPDRAPDWPTHRYWGASRDKKWVLNQLSIKPHPYRHFLLRCTGDYAGAALALEKGLHRYQLPGGNKTHMLVELVAFRSEFTESEWDEKLPRPKDPSAFSALIKLPPAREFKNMEIDGPCHVNDGKRECDVGIGEYWPRFERIAVETLLAHLYGGKQDLDDLYTN
jgi:hypothetical protein